jgi:hypothetical protein
MKKQYVAILKKEGKKASGIFSLIFLKKIRDKDHFHSCLNIDKRGCI